jgi:hypothetical protein
MMEYMGREKFGKRLRIRACWRFRLILFRLDRDLKRGLHNINFSEVHLGF